MAGSRCAGRAAHRPEYTSAYSEADLDILGLLDEEGRMLPSLTQGSDHYRFIRSWVSAPQRVAAIAPSGNSLSRLMTAGIRPESGPVLELGPGTGAFTRAILARGIDEGDLTLVEYDTGFALLLRSRYPRARVLRMDASRIAAPDINIAADMGTIVSGLPLLSMPPRRVMAILAAAFSLARENVSFYQFTYGWRCPVPRPILDRLGLRATRVGSTLRNLPPATVYRITRRRPLAIRS